MRTPSVSTTLLIDAAFEFVAGAALIVLAGTLGDWLRIGSVACVALGVLFLAAGAAILWLRRAPDHSLVQTLAWANVAGGLAGWTLLLITWSALDVEGRTVLGLASDAFIIIGVLELLALRAASRARLRAQGV